MARLLRIEDCDDCAHRGRYDNYCWYTAPRRELPDSQPDIPDWCPLPEESEWIPVGERLPEPGVRVLVVVEGGWIDVGIRDGDGVRAYSGGRITHWQPLPSLPKEATCEICGGQGWYAADDGSGEPAQVQCEACYGTGKRIAEEATDER